MCGAPLKFNSFFVNNSYIISKKVLTRRGRRGIMVPDKLTEARRAVVRGSGAACVPHRAGYGERSAAARGENV